VEQFENIPLMKLKNEMEVKEKNQVFIPFSG
jgi:hypothetical protein